MHIELEIPDRQRLISLLCCSAYAAYSLSLSSRDGRSFKWFSPDGFFPVGQLVMEITTMWDRSSDIHRIGHVISDGLEPAFNEEEWKSQKDDFGGEMPQEHRTRISLLDNGKSFCWEYAIFIAVPPVFSIGNGRSLPWND